MTSVKESSSSSAFGGATNSVNTNRRPRANTIGDPQQSIRLMEKQHNNSPMGRDSCSSGSFVTKLYKMVDSEPTTIVSWIRGGTAFCIVDPKMMAEHCLPKYFRHRRFSSLIRQLNFYSFYRVQEGQLTIYQHSFFRKGRPDLLSHIKRRGAGKAKDPWFDPLSPVNKPPMTMMSMNPLMVAPTPTCNNAMENGQPSETQRHNGSNHMTCYSPMAKPLASSIDNMSPALKPGMAHLMPPAVDLGGGPDEKYVENQRWDNELLEDDDSKEFGEILIKPESLYNHHHHDSMSSHEGMMKTAITAHVGVMDIDIQDFLTDDCSINAGMTEKNTRPIEEREYNGSTVAMKRTLVARNCLKWGDKEGMCEGGDMDCTQDSTSGRTDDDMFEQELLLDLANNVDPNAWEMPLSPLNEAEDVMPWLDLCF